MKKIFAMMLALAMGICGMGATAEKTPAAVYEIMPANVEAYWEDGHVMLALKDLEAAFGLAVTENGGHYTLDNGLNCAAFQLGEVSCTISNLVEDTLAETLGLEIAPVETDGKIYVPAELLRAVLGEDAVNIQGERVTVRNDGYFIHGTPNPMEQQESMEDLSKKVGFEVAAPEKLGDFRRTELFSIETMAQVMYQKGERELCYRISPAEDGDNSGDYTDYETVKNEKIGQVSVTFKGEGEKVSLAIWTRNGYDESVGVREGGVSRDEMIAMLKELGI